MTRFPIASVLAAMLLGASAAVQAGDIYKYRLPDGRVLYSDETSSTGTLEETLTPPPAPVAQPARAQPRERTRAERGATPEAQAREVQEAERGVGAARAALQSGLEPLPGERLGNANGSSRLAPAYWQCIALLREQVERARERLDDAQQGLNEVR